MNVENKGLQDRKEQEATGVKKYKVTIAGESYFLVSDEPEERVREVAEFVDSKIKSISQVGQGDDLKRVATLVALQCVSEMIATVELLKEYESGSKRLVTRITEELPHNL